MSSSTSKCSINRVDKMQFLKARNMKRTWMRYVAPACAAALLLAANGIASAAVVLPLTGGSGYPDGNGAAFPSAGETYQTTINSPVEYVTTPLGPGSVYDLRFYIQTQIYTTPAGTVDFVYQVHNISDNNNSTSYGDSVDRLSVQSFAGYAVTADYLASTGSSSAGNDVAPVTIDRSTPDGSVVGFNFQDYNSQNLFQYTTLIPGAYSDYLVVRTNSTTWQNGTASVIGGEVGQVTVQVPFGAIVSVPEPASLGLIALAGSSLLARRRRSGR